MMTTLIPIYSNDGVQVNCLEIDDKLDLNNISGRVTKGEKYYYKGVGIHYKNHWIERINFIPEFYNFIKRDEIFYLEYKVSKKSFIGKHGIFQEKYAPMFTDFIGTCGVKELSIIENAEFFKLSSVEVIDSVYYDKENQQYYFKVNYKCDRKKYLEGGKPEDLNTLITYTLENNWNFIWDKKSISDITLQGLVSDAGDLFSSRDVVHKFGSVYSVLYSLYKEDITKYIEFIDTFNLENEDEMSVAFNTVEVLRRNGIDITNLIISNNRLENYKNLIYNYLVAGKNCGDCCYIDMGRHIKEHYFRQAQHSFGELPL